MLLGDDGKTYDFIVKYGEDLRQDERIQQFFDLCNKLLTKTACRDLRSLRTYSVIPFSKKLGIIEFVPDTATFKMLAASPKIKDALPKYAKTGCLVRSESDFANAISRSEECGRSFRSLVDRDLGGCLDLVKSFERMSSSPEGFFYLRRNFVASHAQLSIISW